METGGQDGLKRILGYRDNRAWWLTGYGRKREKEKQNLVFGLMSVSLSLSFPSSRTTCRRSLHLSPNIQSPFSLLYKNPHF